MADEPPISGTAMGMMNRRCLEDLLRSVKDGLDRNPCTLGEALSIGSTTAESFSISVQLILDENLYRVMSRILYFRVPAGTSISISSSIVCPNNPLPIGLVTDILFSRKSASASATSL